MSQSTWWTPEGFVSKPAPNAFSSIPDEASDWEKVLKTAGYDLFGSYGGECDLLAIKVWKHTDHVFVEVWNDNYALSNFFVSTEDQNAFFATWYTRFLHDATVVAQGETFSKIQKTFTAFVRHGHGKDTIDGYGYMTWDDYEQRASERRKTKDNMT